MDLFKFGLPVSDLQLLKSMDKETLKAAGIDVEEFEKSIYADLNKAANKAGLTAVQKQVTRNGKQIMTTVYVKQGEEPKADKKTGGNAPDVKPKKGDTVTGTYKGKKITGKITTLFQGWAAVEVEGGKKIDIKASELKVANEKKSPEKKATKEPKKATTPTKKKEEVKEMPKGKPKKGDYVSADYNGKKVTGTLTTIFRGAAGIKTEDGKSYTVNESDLKHAKKPSAKKTSTSSKKTSSSGKKGDGLTAKQKSAFEDWFANEARKRGLTNRSKALSEFKDMVANGDWN
jgi:hypothetical protein